MFHFSLLSLVLIYDLSLFGENINNKKLNIVTLLFASKEFGLEEMLRKRIHVPISRMPNKVTA
jgi:hypothetical protein